MVVGGGVREFWLRSHAVSLQCLFGFTMQQRVQSTDRTNIQSAGQKKSCQGHKAVGGNCVTED